MSGSAKCGSLARMALARWAIDGSNTGRRTTLSPRTGRMAGDPGRTGQAGRHENF
jgi:hypothetical protein